MAAQSASGWFCFTCFMKNDLTAAQCKKCKRPKPKFLYGLRFKDVSKSCSSRSAGAFCGLNQSFVCCTILAFSLLASQMLDLNADYGRLYVPPEMKQEEKWAFDLLEPLLKVQHAKECFALLGLPLFCVQVCCVCCVVACLCAARRFCNRERMFASQLAQGSERHFAH